MISVNLDHLCQWIYFILYNDLLLPEFESYFKFHVVTFYEQSAESVVKLFRGQTWQNFRFNLKGNNINIKHLYKWFYFTSSSDYFTNYISQWLEIWYMASLWGSLSWVSNLGLSKIYYLFTDIVNLGGIGELLDSLFQKEIIINKGKIITVFQNKSNRFGL